jgi:hypothetical protein
MAIRIQELLYVINVISNLPKKMHNKKHIPVCST